MSESVAQSLAAAYWPEVRAWKEKHPKGNPLASGHVYSWLEGEAAKCVGDGCWSVSDTARRAEEILKEKLEQDRLIRLGFLGRAKKLRLDIEQIFIDADYWNKNGRQAGERKINVDPEGTLKEILRGAEKFIKQMEEV